MFSPLKRRTSAYKSGWEKPRENMVRLTIKWLRSETFFETIFDNFLPDRLTLFFALLVYHWKTIKYSIYFTSDQKNFCFHSEMSA